MTNPDPHEPLPHFVVTQNLLSLTARVEQLEMDVKRLEQIILNMSTWKMGEE
jgi:hypothetical protein